jgi:rhodanese-related sulfurtransferase
MRPRPLRVVLLILAGCLCGLAWNAFSGHGFALTSNVYVKPGDESVEVAEAKRRLDAGSALFLDVRPPGFYEMGHIPGALNLPEAEFEQAFARLEPRLRQQFDVVVYCAGFGCEASHIVARQLKARGVPAAVLQEGWPAWTEAGYPTRSGAQP